MTLHHLPLFFLQLLILVTVSIELQRERNFCDVSAHSGKYQSKYKWATQWEYPKKKYTNFFLFCYNNLTPVSAPENLPLVEADTCVSITDGESCNGVKLGNLFAVL